MSIFWRRTCTALFTAMSNDCRGRNLCLKYFLIILFLYVLLPSSITKIFVGPHKFNFSTRTLSAVLFSNNNSCNHNFCYFFTRSKLVWILIYVSIRQVEFLLKKSINSLHMKCHLTLQHSPKKCNNKFEYILHAVHKL